MHKQICICICTCAFIYKISDSCSLIFKYFLWITTFLSCFVSGFGCQDQKQPSSLPNPLPKSPNSHESKSVSHSVVSWLLATPWPGSFVHGILQARILWWIAITFSRGPCGPRDLKQVSCIAGSLWSEPPGKPTPTSPISLILVN